MKHKKLSKLLERDKSLKLKRKNWKFHPTAFVKQVDIYNEIDGSTTTFMHLFNEDGTESQREFGFSYDDHSSDDWEPLD